MKHNGKLALTCGFAGLLAAGVVLARQHTSSSSVPATSALSMQFIKVEPGSFQMGCSPDDDACTAPEKPVHTVQITRGFELGMYEVTQQEYKDVMGHSSPCDYDRFRPSDNFPVTCVTWNDVQKFIQKLNGRKDGYRYRLPTEAEWEYAARAGTTSKNGGTASETNTPDADAGFPGRQEKPNAWGLQNMFGGVWEWTQDWCQDYEAGSFTDPKGPATGSMKIFRGVNSDKFNQDARVSSRGRAMASAMFSSLGFRLVRSAQP